MSSDDITTILGPGSAFTGKLNFEGTVRIEGRFEGEIETEGTLIVGAPAEVEAEIVATRVIIEGLLKGNVLADGSVEIRSPARVFGNITTPSLEIEKGSVFHGRSQMEPSTSQTELGSRSESRGDNDAAEAS